MTKILMDPQIIYQIFSQTDFILQVSLIGLGLLIAIYTLVYPKIERIMDAQAEKIIILEKDFDNKKKQYSISHLSKKERNEKWQELENTKNKIDAEGKPPEEVFRLFLFAVGGFGLPLIIVSLNILNFPILNNIADGIPYFLAGGILMTLLIFILIFVRLHSLIMTNFDLKVRKIREETAEKYKAIKEMKRKVRKLPANKFRSNMQREI